MDLKRLVQEKMQKAGITESSFCEKAQSQVPMVREELKEEYNLERSQSVTSSQAELAQIRAEEDIAKKNEEVLKKRALEELEKKEEQVKDYFEEYKPHSQCDKRVNALGDAAKPSSSLKHEINKINALDKLKEKQEKRLNQHNRQVKAFEELAIDFMVKHDI